ncbi:helix-turn-helix transcriptional regulator [Salmonella enterica subsp. enterica]|nr:AraC family transcriptional regulator [Salmonella enterica subsp. enterica]EDP8718256.1 AraC family transcriptional regulator [Salmonella enterica subsp. enterica]
MSELLHEPIEFDRVLGVKYRKINYHGRPCPKHWHDSFECLFVTGGTMDFYLDGNQHRLQSDDLIFINPREVHGHCCIEENTSALLLQIPEHFFNQYTDQQQFLFSHCFIDNKGDSKEARTKLVNLFLQLDKLHETKTLGYDLKIKSLIFEFIYQLVNSGIILKNTEEAIKSEKHVVRINKVIRFIEKNYSERITLEDCSQLIHVDPTYFSRFFKKYVGETFSRYLNNYRLNKAYIGLLNTDLNITLLAEKNGFSNYKFFLSLFKDRYHNTPQEIRRQLSAERDFGVVVVSNDHSTFQKMYCSQPPSQ